jgi:hypothetical protein
MTSYSRRKLSMASDRLPAIIGLIREYEKITGDEPILGLWRRSFHQDLLWVRMGDRKSIEPISLSGFPSWTWLACPSAIAFDLWNEGESDSDCLINVHDHTILVDWDIIWSSEPFTSTVLSTRLVLRGPTRQIVLRIAPTSREHNPVYLEVEGEEEDFSDYSVSWKYSGQFDFEAEKQKSFDGYTCLLLRSGCWENRHTIMETFLILEQVSGDSRLPFYRRVGIGNFHGKSKTFDLTNQETLDFV